MSEYLLLAFAAGLWATAFWAADLIEIGERIAKRISTRSKRAGK